MKRRDYQELAGYAHPEKGITFVPASCVDFSENLTFLQDRILKM